MQNFNTKTQDLKVKRAASGLGLFAARDFRKGDFLIEYFGEMIGNEEADRRGGKYLFEISSKETIDGKDRANLARYVNHACKPNVEAEIDGQRLFFYAEKQIQAGDELTLDYGKEYFDEFIRPYGCRCWFCRSKQEDKKRRKK